MRKLLFKFEHLLRRREERVMLIEAVDEHFEVTNAFVDNHEKKIFIKRVRFTERLEDIPRPFFLQHRIVIALGSTDATTVESQIHFNRAKHEEVITEEELDGLLFKAFWSFLNQYRAWAAEKMHGNELDLVLAHVEIGDVTIDSRRVVSLTGLKGKECTIQFRGTFVLRDLLEKFSRYDAWASKLSIVERGSVIPSALRKEGSATISITGGCSTVFVVRNHELKFLEKRAWGKDEIIDALAKELSLTHTAAEDVLRRYFEEYMSARMARAIGRIVHNALEPLFGGAPFKATRSYSDGADTIYVVFEDCLPIPREKFERGHIHIVPIENLLRERDFKLIAKNTIHNYIPNEHPITLALLGKLHTYPTHQFLAQLLSRRARWLTATISHRSMHGA